MPPRRIPVGDVRPKAAVPGGPPPIADAAAAQSIVFPAFQ